MTDEELISTLWSGEVTLSTAAAAAVRIKELLRDLKSVLEREAETQVRHEAREDAIREAALREAAVLATSLSSAYRGKPAPKVKSYWFNIYEGDEVGNFWTDQKVAASCSRSSCSVLMRVDIVNGVATLTKET
jgi:hypothetical protein